MSTSMEMLKTNFTKPLVSAGVAGMLLQSELGSAQFYIDAGSIPILSRLNGTSVSAMTFGAALGFISSFMVEALNNVVHTVDKKHRLKSFPSFVTHVVGGMATFAYLPTLIGDIGTDTRSKLIKTGILSEIISQWTHENFIEEGSFGQDLLDLI